MIEILGVTASAHSCLTEKIITGELKPGQKLNECSLSADLGISRPPLREAFRKLENERLVLNVPRKGTYVTELSLRDYEEVSQIRFMMEGYAIDLLKESNITDLHEVTMAIYDASVIQLPLDGGNSKELLEHIKVLLSFHNRLIESSGNLRLVSLYDSIRVNLARYQYIYFNIDGAAQHSLDDHKNILDSIVNGNYAQAKEQLRRHISFAVESVKTRMRLTEK